MFVEVVVTLVILGVVVVLVTYVWKEMSKPKPPVTNPPNLRDPADIEADINRLMPDFEDVRQAITGYGSVDGPYCAEAVPLARQIAALLKELRDHPNKNQASYAALQAEFDDLERFLDSWCTDYEISE